MDSGRESIHTEESRFSLCCGWDLKGADAESTAAERNSQECHEPYSVQLEKKMREQEQRIQTLEEIIGEQEQKIRDQEQRIRGQEQMFREQEQKAEQQEQKIREQELNIRELEQKTVEQEKKIERQEQEMGEQEKMMRGQEKKIKDHEQKIREQEQMIREQEEVIREQEQNTAQLEKVVREHEQEAEQEQIREHQKIGEQEQKIREQEKVIRKQEEKTGEHEAKMREQKQGLREQAQRAGMESQKTKTTDKRTGTKDRRKGREDVGRGTEDKRTGTDNKGTGIRTVRGDKRAGTEERTERGCKRAGTEERTKRGCKRAGTEDERIGTGGEQEEKIKEQEKLLQEEQVRGQEHHLQELFETISPMEDITLQYDGRCDQLISEYDELMTNPDGILGHLEEEFASSFDAEVVLGSVVTAAYEECKKWILDLVVNKLKKLFTAQNEECAREMTDVSRAFGLLLPTMINQKSQLVLSVIIASICETIKQKMQELEPYKRAKKKVDGFPIEKVVELTWKFVTSPKPIIVCQPVEFDSRTHNCESECWNVKQQKPYQLFYIRPVVYRSYHGSVACKGLVGNVFKTQ